MKKNFSLFIFEMEHNESKNINLNDIKQPFWASPGEYLSKK